MQQIKRDFGTIYSEEEERILGPLRRIRQSFLAPFAVVLASLGISADLLSFTSVALAIGFCLLASFQFSVAFCLLVASIMSDGLDSGVARFTRTNNARGSFTDMFCDQLVVAFTMAGMTWRGAIHPALAILFVYIQTALDIFLAPHQLLKVSSRWIIRPGKTLFYTAIGLDLLFHINLLNYLLLVYLLTLPILGTSFWRLRRAL